MTIVDRSDEIASVLATHNCGHEWPTYPLCGSQEPMGTSSDGDGGDVGETPDGSRNVGCGCASGGRDAPWSFMLLALAAMRRRSSKDVRARSAYSLARADDLPVRQRYADPLG